MSHRFYDSSDAESIYKYAKKMINKSFKDIINEDTFLTKEEDHSGNIYENKRRKGGLGELVEEKYFKYKANNGSGADFKEAGVELKVTPYKINKNKTISSKERMIITMINYYKIVEEEFFNSGVWDKSELILIIFYLWEKEIKNRLDYKINYVHLYSPIGEDLKIMIDDFYKIKEKVKDGKAHELSEGDTMYLGAATKASSSKALTGQPFSDVQAKPRAFSFKNSYMTYVLNNYVINKEMKEEKILKDEVKVIDEKSEIVQKKTFEQYVLEKINANIGFQDLELYKKYYGIDGKEDIRKMDKSKGKYSNLAFRMLGVKSNKAEEFEKANVVVKIIRLEKTGKITESSSTPTFVIKELINQSWEESDVYNYFSETKFLFMIFKNNGPNRYFFKKAIFWNMPVGIIDNELKVDWEKFVDKFKEGVILNPVKGKNGKVRVINNLPKKLDTKVIHVRPHTSLAANLINGIKYGGGSLEKHSDDLLNGNRMTKQSFWINNNYLEQIIKNT